MCRVRVRMTHNQVYANYGSVEDFAELEVCARPDVSPLTRGWF